MNPPSEVGTLLKQEKKKKYLRMRISKQILHKCKNPFFLKVKSSPLSIRLFIYIYLPPTEQQIV